MIQDLIVGVAVAFFTSLLASGAMIWIGPMDAPSEARKQHQAPTPTSGGIGIGAGYGAAMVVLSLFSLEWRHEVSAQGVAMLWTSALFAYPLLFVGFIDDSRQLDAKFKFAVYAVLAVAAAWLIGVVIELRIGGYTLTLPFAVGLFGTALWVFTLVNAINFMDGANGVAMGSVAVGLIAVSVVALEGNSIGGAAIALCGVGALAGFLVWNFPVGRLFAGDSGALFAGALAAFACLIVIARTGASPFVAPILFFPLLADVLLTLFDRVRRRQSLFVGHTDHIYQIAIRSGWSHTQIALAYWLAMAACGAIGILADRDPSHTAPGLALAALAGLSVVMDSFIRRNAKAGGVVQP